MSITDSELFELAGPGPFERGYDYYREGQVVDLEIRSDGIVAYVSGTDLYRVSLRHDGVEINGSCDCPASDGIGFCKHCVAAALELRDQLADGALTATSQHDTGLETYLMRQDAKTLSTHLLQVLHRDPVLYERLRQQAELAEGMQDAALLKKAITRVTPLQDVFGSAKVRAYFRRLETVLEGILEIADQVPAEDLLKTAVHGIKRLNKALERLDDSGGYREHAQARLRELHRNALRRIDWTPQRRAKHLLEQALADPWDQYEATPFDYSDALGEAGLSAFYAIVEKRFVGLPVPSKRASFEDRMPFLRLRGYLMMRAREQDDVDELIRLKKLTASTGADFDNIARLYLQKGDPESASRWLSKADELDKSDRRGRQALWASVHKALGDWDAAIAAQEAAFQRDASYEEYKELMDLAWQAGRTAEVRDAVSEFLNSEDPAISWSDERRAWTLARIQKDGLDWAGLKETALARLRDSDRLLQAARWIVKHSLADAGPVYEKSDDALVAKKTNSSYRAAVRALLEARPAFYAVSTSAFDKCVSRLRETHFRKRNFMAFLEEAIGAV
jgi:uncharacterized Zn finger protein